MTKLVFLSITYMYNSSLVINKRKICTLIYVLLSINFSFALQEQTIKFKTFSNSNQIDWILKKNILSNDSLQNQISSILLWYEANDSSLVINNNNKITKWYNTIDKNVYPAVQTDTNYSPSFIRNVSEINKQNAVYFDENNLIFGDVFPIDSFKYISFIIKTQPSSSFGMFISKGYSGNGSFTLARHSSSDAIRYYIDNKSITSDLYTEDKWIILTVFLDRKDQFIKLYKNSILIHSQKVSEDLLGDNNYDWTIGKDAGSTNYHFKGYISDIIFLDKSANDTDRVITEQYLRYKYAPPVNIGYDIHVPYGFCDTTIDAGVRFTNYLWNNGDTTQIISVNKSGQYSVTVTDIFGFESFDSLMVHFPKPYQLLDTTICNGDTIQWNIGLRDTNYTFLWQDNSTDSILSIYTTGDYHVQITDTFGCVFNSDTAHISIDNYPITTTLGDDDTLCAGQSLFLQDGAEETVSYLWSTGSEEDYIIIDVAGEYSVTITNANACVAIDTVNLQIQGYAPYPGFLIENQCLGDLTQFTDTSKSADQANIINWYWDFGNGDTSILQNPQLQYSDTGIYNVVLKIVTDSVCENSINKTVKIYSNPKAQFTASQLCQNYLIDFINTSTSAMGAINYVRWDFGNNDTINGNTIQKVFPDAMNQVIQLKVETENACKDILDTIIEVKPSPKADFSYTPLCEGEKVYFSDQTEVSGVLSIIDWQWENSLGDFSSLENPIFIFDNSQNIDVKLQVISVNGCLDFITKQLWVYRNPINQFNIKDACFKNPIEVENLSVDSQSLITNYYWWINDELISQQSTPDYIMTDTGEQQIKLRIVSRSGCSSILNKAFHTYPLPDSFYKIQEDYTTPIEAVIFTANTINNENKYYYQFGDTYSQSVAIVSHTYVEEGSYQSKLIVENYYSCKDSTEATIKVVEPLLDLEIYQLETIAEEGKTKISFWLSNKGNLKIKDIDFRIEMNDETVFEENYKTNLSVGAFREHQLSTQFLYDANKTHYLCVLAQVKGVYEDVDLSNNLVCLAYKTDENFIKVFPNPTTDELTILYNNIQQENVLNYTIIDVLGKIVLSGVWDTHRDVYKYKIKVSHLASGMYTLKINDDIKKFIKE